MTIERIPAGNRDVWLALRAQDVTASVAGTLLGVHDYMTPYQLWALKSGLFEEDPEDTPVFRRGRWLEPAAIKGIRERHPTWKIEHNTEEAQVYYRDPAARIGATPDATAIDPERPGFGVVQIKSVERSIFERKWQHPDTREIEPPLWIAVQAIIEAHLTGASWAKVAALVVSGFTLDLELIEVPVHKGVITRVQKEVAEFWRRVDAEEPYPVDFGRDGDTLDAIYSEPNGEVDLTADNMIPGLIAERAALKKTIKEAEFRVDEIDAEIKSKLAGAEVGHLPGGKKITWKQQSRRAYSVEAKTFRVLRVPTEV